MSEEFAATLAYLIALVVIGAGAAGVVVIVVLTLRLLGVPI